MEKSNNIINAAIIDTQLESMKTKRIYAIMKWLRDNEQLLEATDAIQLTIHVKRQKDLTDSVQGTILHVVKAK